HGLHRTDPPLGPGRLLGARHRRVDRGAGPRHPRPAGSTTAPGGAPCRTAAPLVHLLLGGPIIAGRTLSRFFAVHVFVVPGLLIALVGLHIWLVLRLGSHEWPVPGAPGGRA